MISDGITKARMSAAALAAVLVACTYHVERVAACTGR